MHTSTITDLNSILAGQFILVRCTIHKYGDSRRDDTATKLVLDDAGADPEAGRFTKRLFAKSVELANCRAAYDAVRTFIYSKTLPWVIGGAETGDKRGDRLLPVMAGGPQSLAFFTDVDQRKAQARVALDELCAALPVIVHRTRAKLGTLFDASLYPSEGDLHASFGAEVSYDAMPELHSLRNLSLPAEIVESIIEQKEKAAGKAMKIALGDVAERVTRELDRIVVQLSKVIEGDKARLHDTLVSNLQGLVPLLDAINVSGDSSMATIVERLRTEIVPASRKRDDWKHSTVLAERTRRAASELKAELLSVVQTANPEGAAPSSAPPGAPMPRGPATLAVGEVASELAVRAVPNAFTVDVPDDEDLYW